ncbi:MAG: ribosome maturation factor RimM [Candidatus Nanopelagicales bacterium]|jgi:16S rRNA processing protein RimM
MRVVVGRIGRPHGIRGQVTVESRTDEPDLRFVPGAQFVIDGPLQLLTVEAVHWHSGRLLLKFEGIHDRTWAESLRNTLLEIDRPEGEQPADPDEFYDDQLEDCVVESLDGTVIGKVTEVIHLPSQDMLSVTRADESEVLVPFIAQFVPTVDVIAKRIVIDPPAGLIEDVEA